MRSTLALSNNKDEKSDNTLKQSSAHSQLYNIKFDYDAFLPTFRQLCNKHSVMSTHDEKFVKNSYRKVVSRKLQSSLLEVSSSSVQLLIMEQPIQRAVSSLEYLNGFFSPRT
ncbi:6945_t:CDS:2 [Funneliformis mosseae]|uniref:6945_t:CDS:1 n=1 Tax=Funneliformis mosseae TaxID=27381 RepID=A0A9N9BLU9_FUNMO|nr:6945_t:CDS:2 [Funneliformis mosseae]